jgi:hypothetical protein
MGRLQRVQRAQNRVAATSPGRHIGATGRVSAQSLSELAKRLGRCGAINEITGYVCVTQPHDDDVEHMSMFIGGPRDGQITSTWGGRKANTGIIATQKVPDA